MLNIILATSSISTIAFLAALTLSYFPRTLHRILPGLVALAAGTLLGAAFFHLLPESLEFFAPVSSFSLMISAFVGFLIMEKILHWRHCHDDNCEEHAFGYLNLVGDALHNFIDGTVIAGAFVLDPTLGVTTTLAIALHELPQEVGDFGVLLHAGFTRQQAIMANVAVALTAVAGGVMGYFLHQSGLDIAPYLLPIAAGGFLYIAAVDLIPEIHRERQWLMSLVLLVIFAAGLLLIPGLGEIIGESQ